MNIREAESLVYKYMAKHDLPDEWLFRWQNKKGALGTCSYNNKEIRLSKWYVELNDLISVRDTILHEIAHALSYVYYGSEGIGHGKLWKDICREIGATPKACSKENLIKPKNHYKYIDTCACGITYKQHRLRKNARYSCPKCREELFRG
jgi:predicted SprT family Zn-dependent metalloprotease